MSVTKAQLFEQLAEAKNRCSDLEMKLEESQDRAGKLMRRVIRLRRKQAKRECKYKAELAHLKGSIRTADRLTSMLQEEKLINRRNRSRIQGNSFSFACIDDLKS